MNSKGIQAQLALSAEFLEAFSALGKQTQAKVRKFMTDFQRNPASPGKNFEKIHAAPDGNLRSVRIDQDYRGILLKPDDGNVFVFLWVDKHDEAYAWAAGRRVTIHPSTGAIQILETVRGNDTDFHTAGPEPAQPGVEGSAGSNPGAPSTASGGAASTPGIFDPYSDAEIIRVGVPEELLGIVRSIHDDEQLQHVLRRFPSDAQEALQYLAAGFSYTEVLDELGLRDEPPAVDTEDFEAALSRDLSRRSVVLITNDTDLQDALDYPLAKWRIFLHPQQERLVRVSTTGPYRVLGAAGTGKTVVAMHRARHLVRTVFPEATDRVLFTTFNTNLARDIRQNLQMLCTAEELDRITVRNIDGWASDYLTTVGRPIEPLSRQKQDDLWDEALAYRDDSLGLPDEFYRHEWDTVIQYQGITSAEEYMIARRIGAGMRLSRRQRVAVWPVFARYRELVSATGQVEYTDVLRMARMQLEAGNRPMRYVAVVIDEAQDMHPEAFRLVRAILVSPDQEIPPNSLFITGDGHQRIYQYPVKLSDCGIPIVGRSRRLKLNYRTTEETRRFATAVLSGEAIDDLDGGTDTLKGYTSLLSGSEPIERPCKTEAEQADAIVAQITEWLGGAPGKPVDPTLASTVCIVAREGQCIERLKVLLKQRDLTAQDLTRDGDPKEDGVRIGTMHRVKGIEYDYMIVADVDDLTVPSPSAVNRQGITETDHAIVLRKEASLLYVALTRARKAVMVSWVGERSRLLPTG
ncbi:MAG: UvrD-helicase domain-containing protein [Alkalispirochaeta sp.]